MRTCLIVLLACGCGGGTIHRPTEGGIAGLARDHDSGDPVAKADLRLRAQGELRPLVATTDASGGFAFAHLRPGRYSLTALFAGQPIDVENIDVRAGDTTVVDVTFTLGAPDAIRIDFGSPKEGAIDRYRPAHHAADTAVIEGAVHDSGTHGRVAGAVVTAVGPGTGPTALTLQAVTDDQGRYRFDPVPVGSYVVSAYYSIGGRAQIEVRRSDIEVGGGEAVIVPLWIEIAKQ